LFSGTNELSRPDGFVRRSVEVDRMGAKNLSLFHRLGITLVILGMMQSLAPTVLRATRSSLRLQGRIAVALAPPRC